MYHLSSLTIVVERSLNRRQAFNFPSAVKLIFLPTLSDYIGTINEFIRNNWLSKRFNPVQIVQTSFLARPRFRHLGLSMQIHRHIRRSVRVTTSRPEILEHISHQDDLYIYIRDSSWLGQVRLGYTIFVNLSISMN